MIILRFFCSVALLKRLKWTLEVSRSCFVLDRSSPPHHPAPPPVWKCLLSYLQAQILSTTTCGLLMSPSQLFSFLLHFFYFSHMFWYFLRISISLFIWSICSCMLTTCSIKNHSILIIVLKIPGLIIPTFLPHLTLALSHFTLCCCCCCCCCQFALEYALWAFYWKLNMIDWVKWPAVNRPSFSKAVVRWVGKAHFSLIIRYRSLGYTGPLDFYQYFQFFSSIDFHVCERELELSISLP